jgi:hypothetical protein
MFYAWDIAITAGTTEAAPVTQTLKVTKGIITSLEIKFPPGCHSLAKVRILRSTFQLIPLSRGEWVTGDAETVKTDPYYELEETPSELVFKGCSPSASYAHTITVRVSIVPVEVGASWLVMKDFIDVLKRMMGA